MSESLGSAVLELNVDQHGLNRGLDTGERRTHQSMERMKGAVRGMGSALTIGFTAPVALMARGFIEEMGEIDTQNARTAAYMHKLGGQSLVTAGHVKKLASAIQLKSGIDDQAAQDAENSILWLGQLNTKTLEGAKTFDIASTATMNWAEATGKPIESLGPLMAKSLAAASEGVLKLPKGLKLGKEAMDDLTSAFKRAKSPGERQALIAEAIGKKFAGAASVTNAEKWAIITDQFKGMGAALMTQLIPAFTKFTSYVTIAMNKFNALSPSMKHIIADLVLVGVVAGPVMIVISGLIGVVEGLAAAAVLIASPIGLLVVGLGVLAVMWLRTGNHMELFKQKLQQVSNWVRNVAFPAIVAGAKAAMQWFQANILPTIRSVVASVMATLTTWFAWGRAAWAKWGSDIVGVVKPAFNIIRAFIAMNVKVIGGIINTALAVLRGDWGDAWHSLGGIVSAVLHGVAGIVKQAIPLMRAAAVLLWSVVKTAVPAALKGLGALLLAAVKGAWAGVQALAPWLLGEGEKLGKAIIDGIIAGVDAAAGALMAKMKSISDKLLKVTQLANIIKSPSQVYRDQVGRPIMDGIALGLTLGLPATLQAMSANMAKLREASDVEIESAKAKAEKAKAALAKVGSLKAAQHALLAAEKNHDQQVKNANLRVQDAERAVAAAKKTKGSIDDQHARNELANARLAYSTVKGSITAAKAQLALVNKLNTAYVAAQKAADKAAADAAAAEQQAQTALDNAQAHQDAISAGLDAIKDKASLALNSDDLNEALAGGSTLDTLRQRISDLKSEYDELQTYLRTNAADLSTSVQGDIIGTMAQSLSSINDLQKQVYDVTHASSDQPVTSSGVIGGSGTGSSGGTQPTVNVTQNFSSEPDMLAASRSAMFAWQTAGLAAAI